MGGCYVPKEFVITKASEEQRIVFGWANVAVKADGSTVEDLQGDIIEPEEMERAAYEYVLNFRDTGELHDPGLRKKGKLVESVVFTKEKAAAMGIPDGIVPNAGWWIGFKIMDAEAWRKIKNGEYRSFSVEGTGERQKVQKTSPKPQTFLECLRKMGYNSDVEQAAPLSFNEALARITEV